MENMKCETNVALNYQNEILDRKDELYDLRNKLKQNMIVSEENECEYVTLTRTVFLTSTNIMASKQKFATLNSLLTLLFYYLRYNIIRILLIEQISYLLSLTTQVF